MEEVSESRGAIIVYAAWIVSSNMAVELCHLARIIHQPENLTGEDDVMVRMTPKTIVSPADMLQKPSCRVDLIPSTSVGSARPGARHPVSHPGPTSAAWRLSRLGS
jgi:hypothetical protein